MCDGRLQRARIGLEEALTPQAGRVRSGRPGLGSRLRQAGARRGLRRRLVADGQREPYQVRKPLVDQVISRRGVAASWRASSMARRVSPLLKRERGGDQKSWFSRSEIT
jgi:hypothetical protein